MELLGHFVQGPQVLYLILFVLFFEALALTAMAYRRRQATPALPRGTLLGTLATLGAGACLVLAMLASALQAPWGWSALCLSAAFIAHLVDLLTRWRR